MLNIAVSSKLILDMNVPCKIFDEKGKDAFERHMADNLEEALPPGPLLPLIKAFQETGLVNFYVVSKIGPTSGKRITHSLKHHGIKIPDEQLIYKDGFEAYAKAKDLNVHAYFSCNEQDVSKALEEGIPAAYLKPIPYSRKPIQEIRIAMDFDGFIASDHTDRYFYSNGLDSVREYEYEHRNIVLPPGPFQPFATALSNLRKALLSKPEGIQLKLAIVTARCEEKCGPRALNCLKAYGVEVDEMHFLDGAPKGPVVKKFGAQLFFDDNIKYVNMVAEEGILSGHTPLGISNANWKPATHSSATERPVFYRSSPSPSPRLREMREAQNKLDSGSAAFTL